MPSWRRTASPRTETERLVLDGDLKLSYVPLRNNQFNSLTWGTEVLYSDNQYLASNGGGNAFNETVGSWGMYSYLTYKWSRRWSGGFLFEFAPERPGQFRANLRLFALHHLGDQPLEPAPAAVHPYPAATAVHRLPAQRRAFISSGPGSSAPIRTAGRAVEPTESKIERTKIMKIKLFVTVFLAAMLGSHAGRRRETTRRDYTYRPGRLRAQGRRRSRRSAQPGHRH